MVKKEVRNQGFMKTLAIILGIGLILSVALNVWLVLPKQGSVGGKAVYEEGCDDFCLAQYLYELLKSGRCSEACLNIWNSLSDAQREFATNPPIEPTLTSSTSTTTDPYRKFDPVDDSLANTAIKSLPEGDAQPGEEQDGK